VNAFEDAWLAVFGHESRGKFLDSALHLSPDNILASYAISFESGYSTTSKDDAAIPIFSSNKGNANHAISGFCRTFELPFAPQRN